MQIKKNNLINRFNRVNYSDNSQLGLGLESKEKLRVGSRIKRKASEIWFSGSFENIWFINTLLLNLCGMAICSYLISKYYPSIQNEIGIRLQNGVDYNYLLSKKFIFVMPLLNLVAIVNLVVFGIKSQRKINNLFILLFASSLPVVVFEFFALRDYIFYFVG